MKFNLFSFGRAVRALIVTITCFCLAGMILCPELVSYSPENPVLLEAQRDFAIAALCIGILSGGLFYWGSTRG